MQKIKPFILPTAIVLGLLLHGVCALLSGIVPYLVFAVLLLTFSTLELRRMRFSRLDLWLAAAQIALAAVFYAAASLFTDKEAVPQGLMMCALCPVASSVTVVAVMLGASHTNTIAYTMVCNLLVSAAAPVAFILTGYSDGAPAVDAFFAIFGRVATVIGLPFFVMLFIQIWIKPLAAKLKNCAGLSFYLWALALFLTLGKTIDYIFIDGAGNGGIITALAVGAAAICAVQFGLGRMLGRRFGDPVAGQQLLGQKNSAMGIWMATAYLNPLSSVAMAFYSIWQNVFNSWQIWRKGR